jgi:hypothetical protein
MKQCMSWLHLNVVATTREYPLVYSLPIWCYEVILKLALTTTIEVVDWGKAKRHTILEAMLVDFLKQDFEWTLKWFWYLNNVKVNIIESTLKVLDFA